MINKYHLLVGGAVGSRLGGDKEIILSLAKMNNILQIDKESLTMDCESGIGTNCPH